MSETSHKDFIKEIIDANKMEIPLITFSEQNVIFIKIQVNIHGSFPQPEFKFKPFCSTKLKNPTPLQYCIISNNSNSLIAILNFMCNKNDDFQFFALPQYQKGLRLELEPVFFPTETDTVFPLLHLSIALGRKECLTILTDFLKGQNKLADFINRPDKFQMTPLSIAFATENEDIILHLLENGADPYFSPENEKVIMPFIFTCINFPDQVEKSIESMKKFYKNDNFNAFEKVENLFFDENGFAFKERIENSMNLDDFLKKVPEVRELYSSGLKADEELSTLRNLSGIQILNNDENQPGNEINSQNNNCSVSGCNEKSTKFCSKCKKYFCENHIDNHEENN